jgi:PEP-CTERM motif-containing protein
MTKVFLVAGLLLLMAAPLNAHVRPGSIPGSGKTTESYKSKDPREDPGDFEDEGNGNDGDQGDEGQGEGENPSQPVPEPGTMALGAMGMMALGAAIRKHRNKQ